MSTGATYFTFVVDSGDLYPPAYTCTPKELPMPGGALHLSSEARSTRVLEQGYPPISTVGVPSMPPKSEADTSTRSPPACFSYDTPEDTKVTAVMEGTLYPNYTEARGLRDL